MNYIEAFESIQLKFTSGNDIPVERAHVLKEEWESIRSILEYYNSMRENERLIIHHDFQCKKWNAEGCTCNIGNEHSLIYTKENIEL
jgi:hypothetical protein